MSGLTIELINDYFIEVDELNHTLKKRYMGKTKEGVEKQTEKTIGHYKNVQDCVERLVRLICLDECDGMVISLREYADMSEKAFKKVEEWRRENYGKINGERSY